MTLFPARQNPKADRRQFAYALPAVGDHPYSLYRGGEAAEASLKGCEVECGFPWTIKPNWRFRSAGRTHRKRGGSCKCLGRPQFEISPSELSHLSTVDSE